MKTVVSHIIGSGRQSLRIHFKRFNFHACVLCAVSVAIGSFASTGDRSADTNNPPLGLAEMSIGEQVGKSSVFPATNVILGMDAPTSGGNVLGRWTRRFSVESELKLQIDYDHYQRKHPDGGGVIVAAPNEFDEDQNLLDERHPEFASYKTSNIAEIPRSIVGRLTVRF